MNPGRLRERIVIQKRSTNAAGPHRSPERSEAPWVKDFSDRASGPDMDNQRTDVVAGKEEPEQRATFTVRSRAEYRTGAITTKRIVWEGGAYEIEGVRPVDPRRRYLEVTTVYKGEAA